MRAALENEHASTFAGGNVMRLFLGSLFAAIVLVIIYTQLVDVHTHLLKAPGEYTIPVVLGLVFVGILGFILISGRGYSKEPRRSKYDH